MEERKLKLSPPWDTYASEVKELFVQDPDVHVVFDEDGMELKLFVDNDTKAEALLKLLPAEKDFGNVKLKISVVPANLDAVHPFIDLIRKAFDGNPAVSGVYDLNTPFGEMSYVVCEPRIVQFYNDDMGDINGNRTMLMRDVAADILGSEEGVYFCTEAIRVDLEKPLGEWP